MSESNEIIDAEVVEIAESVELSSLEAGQSDTGNGESIEVGMDCEPEEGQKCAAPPLDGPYYPDRPETSDAAYAKHTEYLANSPERRCVAHRRNGEQCRKWAIKGSTVCRTHGGATQHVRKAANIRVQMASDRLVSKLIEFAFDDTKPPDTQLRAIRDALDRAGMQPKTEVEIGVAKPFEAVFDAIGGSPTRDYDAEHAALTGAATAGHPNTASAESLEALRRSANRTGLASDATRQYASSSPGEPRAEGDASARQAGGDERDRERQPQGDERDRERQPQDAGPHITGMAAIRMANMSNAAIGALRPPKELESPHKRYRNPYDV